MWKKLFTALWRNSGFGWRVARIMLSVATLFYVVVLSYLMLFESKFIFFPAKYPAGRWELRNETSRAGEIVPRIEDEWLTSVDGVRVHGWFCTPLRGSGNGGAPAPLDDAPVLLFLHGNAGNLTHRYDLIRQLVRLPVRVLIIDYRGYGKSDGRPDEAGVYADARAAWDYLVNERHVSPAHIVVFGESLGGAVAVDLASKVQPCGLIVQSSFTSIGDMAAELMPFVPRLAIRTKLDSLSKITHVSCPKLFIHSPADEVVPYKFGRRLFDAAPPPKQFYEVKNSPHNLTDVIGGDHYFDALRNFINSTCARVVH